MARGEKIEIENWEAHLWHIICGVWADRRCRICGLCNQTTKALPQWDLRPPAARRV
jgi:hypothetical protein